MSAIKDKIILAADTDCLETALTLVDELRDYVGLFKVGLQLYSRVGTRLFAAMQAHGASIFFDGKFHDIPNTVAQASAAIAARQPFMFNIHATGGSAMMKASVQATDIACAKLKIARPKIIAVTLLTSLGRQIVNEELNINGSIKENVLRLAGLTRQCGLDGVVASAQEVAAIKKLYGKDFLTVCPGVRPSWAEANDQTRIVTPAAAIAAGADYIVIGRPVTQASNRVDAARRILDEVEQTVST